MGNGVEPNRYQQAVPLHSSRGRCPSPYQPSVRRSHTVCGSCSTCSSEGSRGPTTRGRPIVCGSRTAAGWWIMESKRNGAISVICWRAQCSPSSPDAVGSVPKQLHRHSRQPTPQQADDLAGPHTQSFVADSQIRADLRGSRQDTQKGQGPSLPGSRASLRPRPAR
jgi:hypothetical protein